MTMKKIFLSMLALLSFACCTKQTSCEAPGKHVEWAYNAVIYELNTRQFTPEGTFAAATEQLPVLKDLGVDIIWVMPMQPIGELGRKGGLGSYYAIKDYCAVNPEFGTKEDFQAFVDKAHGLGMKVILDWVANHTAPDHPWTQNEGWHYRDSLGNLMVQYDWTDISKLNYSNADMRHAMLESMKWWLDTFGIDGFRCDVAYEVPTDFWDATYDTLRMTHPNIFTLSEAEHADSLLTVKSFDMYYGWELHHIMNDVAQGKKNADSLWAYFAKADTIFPDYAIRMNFTSNHDENSWAGTEMTRMGDAYPMFAAFTYFIPGMPLIYTGQEYGSNRMLRFFDKDTIERKDNAQEFAMYKKLNKMRHESKILRSQEKGAAMHCLTNDNNAVFSAIRVCPCGKKAVVGIFNMTDEEQTVNIPVAHPGLALPETFTDLDGVKYSIKEPLHLTLAPWQYIIMQ